MRTLLLRNSTSCILYLSSCCFGTTPTRGRSILRTRTCRRIWQHWDGSFTYVMAAIPVHLDLLQDLAARGFITHLLCIHNFGCKLLLGTRIHKQIAVSKPSTPNLLFLYKLLFFPAVAVCLNHDLFWEHAPNYFSLITPYRPTQLIQPIHKLAIIGWMILLKMDMAGIALWVISSWVNNHEILRDKDILFKI